MKRLCSIFLAVCMAAGLGTLCAVPAAALGPYEPPSNLGQLSQAEQLDYFNLVVNRVRAEKPGFRQRESWKIDKVQTSVPIIGSMVDSALSNLAPGDWEQTDVAAGESNEGLFLSGNANASDLRPQDITSISAQKAGDNWVIELCVREETNPAPGLGSANGRIAAIATREQIIEGMTGTGVTASPADAAVHYGSGFARVTVNGEGKVIVAANGFQVNALFHQVRVSVITMDMAVTQNDEWQYACFDWAPAEGFPPAHVFPAGTLPAPRWWQALPPVLQWILRYIFFGWIWMAF